MTQNKESYIEPFEAHVRLMREGVITVIIERMRSVAVPYSTGDVIGVRETWALPTDYKAAVHGTLEARPRISPVVYKADYATYAPWENVKWRKPKTMPRWAIRIWFTVNEVRVSRVQDIGTTTLMNAGFVPGADGKALFTNFVDNPPAWLISVTRVAAPKEA